MNSKIQSFGYDIALKTIEGEKVYEYTPTKQLAAEFQMCDLFILGKYIRQHHKIASKQKLIFKYESDLRLADFPITTDPTVLKNIATQLFEAVYTLHTHNIPARCITPQNVLWNQQSQEVILMDFGLSPQLPYKPPELLNKHYCCYGIEIDLFLIGRILHCLYFKKDIELQKGQLMEAFNEMKYRIERIDNPFIRKLLLQLLQFNMAKRISFQDLSILLGCRQEIQDFYKSNKFKHCQRIIDQKIFFREAKADSVYEMGDSALIESVNYEESNSQSLTNSNISKKSKIVITEVTDQFNNQQRQFFEAQINFSLEKFECLKDLIGSLNEFDSVQQPLIPLCLLAIKLGQIYFKNQVIQALKNDNYNYFFMTKEQWKVKQQCQKFYEEKITEQNKTLSNIKVSLNINDMFQKTNQILNNTNFDNKKILMQWFSQLQNSKYEQEDKSFLDGYRKILLEMQNMVDENIDFTSTVTKANTLRLELILAAFADILFNQDLKCYKQVKQVQQIDYLVDLQSLKKIVSEPGEIFSTLLVEIMKEISTNQSTKFYIQQL